MPITETADSADTKAEGYRGVGRDAFRPRPSEVYSAVGLTDVIVYVLLLGFGLFQVFCVQHTSAFGGDDVFFADSGRSLVQHGFYGINGFAETNMPPGPSAILGVFGIIWGFSRLVCLRVLAIFGVLGFLATYELLRRQAPRLVAAAICLLLISSQVHFALATQSVSPCYPFFFTTLCVLLVARQFDRSRRLVSVIGWGALLAILVAASLLIASSAMAFLAAILASTFVLLFQDRRLGFTRLKRYLPILLVGVVIQGFSAHKGSADASAGIGAMEWPVPGFPQSYVAQLKVKNGNNPELGMATPRDLVVRIFENASAHADLLSRMLLRRLPQVAWMSIFVVIPLLLVSLGWAYSVWHRGGGFQEWYFAGYEFIYLLWPWNIEARFFFPVAPLACLYMWRGCQALCFLVKSKPRLVGAAWFPIALVLAASAWLWVRGTGFASRFPNAGLEDELSFSVWSLSAILAARMVWANTSWLTPVSTISHLLARKLGALRTNRLRISRLIALPTIAVLIFVGLKNQIATGRGNLDPNSALNRTSSDAEAGVWLGSHTDPSAVIMARQVPTIYHYSQRKVVWFPPSTNPQLLMAGIQRHKVEYVVVVRRAFNYYLPADDLSFRSAGECLP